MDAVKNVNVLNENTASLWQAEPQPPALNRFSMRSFHVVVVGPIMTLYTAEKRAALLVCFSGEDHNRR